MGTGLLKVPRSDLKVDETALISAPESICKAALEILWPITFDFLERHWPTLVNGIESDLIPTTNNAVELVIRRFDQHYQNFCGFEKLYRFTPFSADAQPRIRGKCPLELAGYDIFKLPITQVCRGQLLGWPAEALAEVVPNG